MEIIYEIKKCFNSYSSICIFLLYNFCFCIASLGINGFIFFQMTKYYRKLNFDNIIVLLNFLDLIIFLINMIYSEIRIFYYIFIFIRILIICIINLNFVKASEEFLKIKYYWINYLIIVFNFIFLIAGILLWELYIKEYYHHGFYKDIIIYVNFSSYFIELMALVILIFYCRKYLILIKQKIHNETESFNLQENERESVSNNPINGNKKNITLFDFNMDNGTDSNELFFKSKKKQIMILLLTNIILTIISLIISIIIVIYHHRQYTIIIFGYISDLIEIIHSTAIFISFYYIIRKQFESENHNCLLIIFLLLNN